MGAFEGFGKQALPFFKALGFHQSREWFLENRAIYDEEVVAPMNALIEDLTARFAKARIPLRGTAKSTFRINRDIRFSRDKRPYKTHMGAVLTPTGDKAGTGLLYLHIAPKGTPEWDGSPEGSFAAAGFHQPSPEALAALRKAIARDPKRYLAMEKALAAKGLGVGKEGAMSRMPRGFEELKESPVAAAIRLRSYIVEEPMPERLLAKPELAGWLEDFTRRALPLLNYGWKILV
ncbi:MAG: TIGR02453 family protein [Bauldia sp.]|nr:TIGR02453 family protein [Bauldia sp.]